MEGVMAPQGTKDGHRFYRFNGFIQFNRNHHLEIQNSLAAAFINSTR